MQFHPHLPLHQPVLLHQRQLQCYQLTMTQTVNRGEPRTEPIFGNPAKFSSFSFLESIDNSTQPQLQETQSSSVTRTPFFNPLRCSRRKIKYPKTPNLLNPTISAKSPPQVSDVSSEPDLTHPTEIDDPGIKAFKKVMEAVFQRNHEQ